MRMLIDYCLIRNHWIQILKFEDFFFQLLKRILSFWNHFLAFQVSMMQQCRLLHHHTSHLPSPLTTTPPTCHPLSPPHLPPAFPSHHHTSHLPPPLTTTPPTCLLLSPPHLPPAFPSHHHTSHLPSPLTTTPPTCLPLSPPHLPPAFHHLPPHSFYIPPNLPHPPSPTHLPSNFSFSSLPPTPPLPFIQPN